MTASINYFIKKATDWLFRKKSPALYAARSGFFLMTVSLAGSWAMFVTYYDSEHFFEINYHSSHVGAFIALIGFLVGCAAFVGGLLWEFKRYIDETKLRARNKTIVIEQRGLVDTTDSPLEDYITSKSNINTESVINDIRERIVDNVITRPDLALLKLQHLGRDIQVRKDRLNSSDVSVAYGGIMPVPFAFYTGYLLDDETIVSLYDWFRDESCWREVDEEDDFEEFDISSSNVGASEAVIAISFSYLVDKVAIESEFAGKSIHYLTLPKRNRNNHWSKTKQNRLAGDFLEFCKLLQENGVEKIHLILASQNSVSFRFGQAYDKRNLPRLAIYQYEKHFSTKYAWALVVPHSSDAYPSIVSAETIRAA
ncbi:SAVED domain-containing protein [Pseudoalteromonas phenolica]|uniref:SAVED domain-containing protein n=1 Tax=Pseudoalteromonas phenolica TaxID=161398 RepID=UPI00384AFDE7